MAAVGRAEGRYFPYTSMQERLLQLLKGICRHFQMTQREINSSKIQGGQVGTALCALAQGPHTRSSGPPSQQEKEVLAESWPEKHCLYKPLQKRLSGLMKTHSSPAGSQVITDSGEPAHHFLLCSRTAAKPPGACEVGQYRGFRQCLLPVPAEKCLAGW